MRKEKPGDRFAEWTVWPARFLLAGLAVLLILSAMVPLGDRQPVSHQITPLPSTQNVSDARNARDSDLILYDRIIKSVENGEPYYEAAVKEQRNGGYPVRPATTVRLPTLAYIYSFLGEAGLSIAAIILFGGTIWAWWRRLGEEPGGQRHRIIGSLLIAIGASLGLTRHFFVLQEIWAGMLLCLAFGLHRPGKWKWAIVAAGGALFIRELALPFILLFGTQAAWRKDWSEAVAWAMLTVAFAAFVVWHFGMVASLSVPGDPQSQGWLAYRGLAGWLGNIVQMSILRLLAHWAAGPMVVLSLIGWAGWKSAAGETGTWLFLGYGLLFMAAGRDDNFYWGAMISPALLLGLAFAPMALRSLTLKAFATLTVAHSARN